MLLTSTGENFFHLVLVLVIFVGILIITAYTTKWLAGYQKKLTQNSNFEVIDSINIGSNQRLLVVKVGKERYLILGVGKEEINLLGEINQDELIRVNSNRSGSSGKKNFADILEKFNKKLNSQK